MDKLRSHVMFAGRDVGGAVTEEDIVGELLISKDPGGWKVGIKANF